MRLFSEHIFGYMRPSSTNLFNVTSMREQQNFKFKKEIPIPTFLRARLLLSSRPLRSMCEDAIEINKGSKFIFEFQTRISFHPREMAEVFGPRPCTQYKVKCTKDHFFGFIFETVQVD